MIFFEHAVPWYVHGLSQRPKTFSQHSGFSKLLLFGGRAGGGSARLGWCASRSADEQTAASRTVKRGPTSRGRYTQGRPAAAGRPGPRLVTLGVLVARGRPAAWTALPYKVIADSYSK